MVFPSCLMLLYAVSLYVIGISPDLSERRDVVKLEVSVEGSGDEPRPVVGRPQARHRLVVRGEAGEEATAGQQVPYLLDDKKMIFKCSN